MKLYVNNFSDFEALPSFKHIPLIISTALETLKLNKHRGSLIRRNTVYKIFDNDLQELSNMF